MKADIHPKYGPAVIQCACGNVIETRSTKERIQVEVCSACHSFFTGKQKLMDTAGRIDRFKKKFGERVALGSQKKQKKAPAVLQPPKKLPLPGTGKAMKDKLQEAKEKAVKQSSETAEKKA